MCSSSPVLGQAVNTTPSPRDQNYVLFGKKANKDSSEIRSVRGTVLDTNRTALAGATVQLNQSSGATLRTVISGKDGSFRFDDLSSKQDYQLQAVFRNRSSQPRKISQYDTRKTLSVELQVEEAQRSAKP